VFDCSYRDLPSEQQRLFRLLSVHPGLDFPPRVAAAIAGIPVDEVRAHLDGLVWAWLLEVREGDRYAFHDLLRDYAGERLEIEESESERGLAVRRMTDWFLHTCNNADRMLFSYRFGVPMLPLAHGVKPLEFEDDDAAMNWYVRERAEITGVIDRAASVGLHEHVWRLVHVAGEAMMGQGFKDEVLQGLRAAVASACAAGDRFGEAGSLVNLGFACSRFHDHEEADRCYRRSYELATGIGHQICVATALRNMGERAASLGRHAEATRMFEQALAIARQENSVDTEAGVLHRIGEALRQRGQLDEALTKLHMALGLRERIGDAAGHGTTLVKIAALHLERGDHHGALGFAHQAMAELRRTRQLALEAEAAVVAATVHRDLKDLRTAESYAEDSVALSRRARDPLRQAAAQDVLGQVRWGQGRVEEARECWEVACGLYADLGDSRASGIRLHLDEFVETNLPSSRSAEDMNVWMPIDDGGSA
jgi:tetratricopeptide (TPR) repeat protein